MDDWRGLLRIVLNKLVIKASIREIDIGLLMEVSIATGDIS